MKKTIIALLALSSVVSAAVTTWDSTLGDAALTASGTNVQSWDVSSSGLTWTSGKAGSIIWTMDAAGLDLEKDYTLLSIKDVTYNGLSNVYISNGELCLHKWNSSSASASVSLSDTIPDGVQTLTFVWSIDGSDAVSLTAYADDSFDSAIATLTPTGAFSFSGKTFSTLYFGGNPSAILGNGDTLVPDGDDASEWNLLGAGYVVGSVATAADVKSYYAATIPEPTTATLSLLALAGLAARRRRK